MRRLLWLSAFAIAMAYLESAVVVYLRALYYPGGFSFPMVAIPPAMAAIEIGREAATIVMLLAVAVLTGRDRWERFLAFNIAFGVWDIFYYAWLWVFLRWPATILDWDVLFLIPVPWIGPVLAPMLVSVALIVTSVWLWALRGRGIVPRFSRADWLVAIVGGGIVLLSFMLDFRAVVDGQLPSPYRWDLFTAGMVLALGAWFHGMFRSNR